MRPPDDRAAAGRSCDRTACRADRACPSLPAVVDLHRAAATKQLGQAFIAFGGGVMYAVAKNHGALLNLNFVVPVPSVGFVFEPSIGYAFGF